MCTPCSNKPMNIPHNSRTRKDQGQLAVHRVMKRYDYFLLDEKMPMGSVLMNRIIYFGWKKLPNSADAILNACDKIKFAVLILIWIQFVPKSAINKRPVLA